MPGFGIDVWFGFAAPAKTPADLLDTIHADMAEVLRDPEFLNAFVRPQGFTVSPMSRAEFAAHMAADYERWGKMVTVSGLQRRP